MAKRVLLIDDMPETLALLMAYLTNEGFDVVTADNGVEALSLFISHAPDVIVSDIMMPKMGGFEFMEKIRRSSPALHIPIIFMSAKQKNIAEQMALDLGAEAFLEKPVSLTVVKAAIEAALKKNSPPIEPKTWQSESAAQPKRAQFICEAYFEGGGYSGLTVASSISRSGLFLDTFSNIPAGTVLHLRLKLRPGIEVEMLGEVNSTVKNAGVGLRFLTIDSEAQRLIDEAVEQRLKSRAQRSRELVC